MTEERTARSEEREQRQSAVQHGFQFALFVEFVAIIVVVAVPEAWSLKSGA